MALNFYLFIFLQYSSLFLLLRLCWQNGIKYIFISSFSRKWRLLSPLSFIELVYKILWAFKTWEIRYGIVTLISLPVLVNFEMFSAVSSLEQKKNCSVCMYLFIYFGLSFSFQLASVAINSFLLTVYLSFMSLCSHSDIYLASLISWFFNSLCK